MISSRVAASLMPPCWSSCWNPSGGSLRLEAATGSGEWQAGILNAEQSGPRLRVVGSE
jgi:hypothetical protein